MYVSALCPAEERFALGTVYSRVSEEDRCTCPLSVRQKNVLLLVLCTAECPRRTGVREGTLSGRREFCSWYCVQQSVRGGALYALGTLYSRVSEEDRCT